MLRMVCPLRLQFPGAIHHVMSRGIERRPIVRDDGDRHLADRCGGGKACRVARANRGETAVLTNGALTPLNLVIAPAWLGQSSPTRSHGTGQAN